MPGLRHPAKNLILLLCSCVFAGAQYSRPNMTGGVGIDQNLNKPLPLETVFRDESGQMVPLRSYFGEKPVLLEFMYFSCTSLCPMSVHEAVTSLGRTTLQPGKDYEAVIVSIDPADTPALAREKKADYARQFGKSTFNSGWHFLTGTQDSISKLAAAAGFHYRWDTPTRQFVHAGGLMIATPDGNLSRYFYGIQYAPQDLRMSLVEASEHKIGSPVDYVLLFCLHYDATQGRYTLAIFNLLKVAGTLTLMALIALLYKLSRKEASHVV